MNWLAPKLHLRLAQKQILTPGLVQMVSVLALNRLELREMINQEIMANPVLEELAEDGVTTDSYTDEAFLKKETEKVPETPAPNPFDEFVFGSFFGQYLDTGAERAAGGEHEEIERPSFDKFLSSPSSLTDHLAWQLSVSISSETVRKIAGDIVGNLDENGYLTTTLEELMQSGNYTLDDVEEALTMVQEFDPPGIGARDLPECLLLQLKVIDPQNQLAKQILTQHRKLLQNNQIKELARAVNRAPELVKRAIDVIKRLDPKPGLRYNKIEPRLVEPDVQFAKVDGEWVALMNDDDLPQLRLSPIYRRLLARAAANKYAHMPQGVKELREFFSESVNGPQGADMSLLSLKRRVKKMIEDEDATHPLTDDQITKRLQDEGIQVTRRTVAKYREDLRIPSTHRRRVKE